MQYPQLVLGMLAIFTYVGVEVAIGSNLGELLKLPEFGGHQSSGIAPYISMYWGSLMIGRWAGAISVFHLSSSKKTLALIIVPLLAFSVIIGVNTLAQKDMTPLYYYVVCVVLQIAAFFISKDKPARTLTIFSIFGVVAMLIGLFTTGNVAIYAFLAGGLACSIDVAGDFQFVDYRFRKIYVTRFCILGNDDFGRGKSFRRFRGNYRILSVFTNRILFRCFVLPTCCFLQ